MCVKAAARAHNFMPRCISVCNGNKAWSTLIAAKVDSKRGLNQPSGSKKHFHRYTKNMYVQKVGLLIKFSIYTISLCFVQ